MEGKETVESLWKLAGQLVDSHRPGDFNQVFVQTLPNYDQLILNKPIDSAPPGESLPTQALMELGATVCSPKAPSCSSCPVQGLCGAYAASQPDNPQSKARRTEDIEDCCLCLSSKEWNQELGVTNWPR